MPDEWSTFGPDLLVGIDPGDRRRSLEDELRRAVRSGRLGAGVRVPSTRTLAAELGLARGTVAEAYAQLVAEGFLVSRRGSGTRVADHAAVPGSVCRRVAPDPARRAYDLGPGRPDLADFPRSAWLAATRRALASAPASDLDYPDPRGLPALREQLTEYLARVRGVETTPDRVIVTAGFGQALHLLSAVLARGAGRRTASMGMEAYGIAEHRDVVRDAGLRVVPVPVDDDGADVSRLAGEAGVVVTAAHQYPLGSVLSPARRERLVRWATRADALVVEDDYDGEFRYDRRPVGALQGLAPDRVAYAGTASKSLAPGVHLGWLALPDGLVDDVVRVKRAADGFTGVLEQLTLAELLRSGGYDRHVRRSRLRYRRRRDRLVVTLAERRPGVRVTGVAAGLHAVVTLGGSATTVDEQEVVSRAGRAGLTLSGLGHHRVVPDRGAPAALVVGYATPPDHAFARALELLVDVLPE